MTRPLLVTHDHCLDGAACGVLGQAAGFDVAFVYPDGAAAYLAELDPERPVVLADVSFARSVYDREQHRLLALLDHHQSALTLSGLPRVHLDLRRCGSTLLYAWLTETGRLAPGDAWTRLLTPIEDYDLWRPDHRLGERLNRLFHALGWEWFQAKYAAGWVPLTAAEEQQLAALEAAERAFVARQVQAAERFQAGRLHLAVVSLDEEGAVNEVAHALIADGHDAVFIIKPDGRLSCRSTDAVDAARLMEEGFSGGGHRRAAGGRLPPESGWPGPEAAHWLIRRLKTLLDATS
jgi:oligoribonuclease NrnB/cAMP/cGMP phosphodiesterase (DHH superfamily)